MSRVLITGAGGLLGSAVAQAARARGDDVTPLTRADLDVTDTDVGDRLHAHKPEVIVHCAAWTDVDGAEAEPAEAMRVNRDGTAAVCAAAVALGATVVIPSSDYVFDGAKGSPYVEDDPPAPVNAYGRTKLAGELAAREVAPHAVRVARTAWLYGEGGNNFVDSIRRLARERDEVAVVDDQIGSPTWTVPLADALLDLPRCRAGTYHVACEGAVTWADLAEKIVERTAPDCRIRRTSTSEFGRSAPRPDNSALASSDPSSPQLGAWDDMLLRYLDQ